MGGSVIGQYASKFSEQIQSLIFIDGLPFSQTHSIFQSLALYPPLLKWADVILEHKFLNIKSFQELLSSAYSKDADIESATGYMKPFEVNNSGSAIFRMAAHSGYSNTNDSVINSIPKLIIWGKNDQWIPITNASTYLKKPHTQSFIIEDAGHCPMETHPQKVNKAITDFISKLE
jgi:pimeloyl-ACP methyl ester carboxylesterase